MKLKHLPLCLVAGLVLFVSSAVAQDANGRLPIIARGELRQEIQATPILERPNRPLHFYGNTVRRRYSRTGIVPVAPAPRATSQQ